MARTLLLALVLAAPGALAEPTIFGLDGAQSELFAFTQPKGLLKGIVHQHVVRAQKVTGKIVFDKEEMKNSWVMVSFPVSALAVDEPEQRRRFALTRPVSESDRKKIDQDMRAAKQLHQARYPQVSFASTRVIARGDDRLDVTGKLTIRGVTREVTVPIRYAVEADTFRGEGELTVNHTDFGFKPYSAVLGTIQNDDPIRIRLELVGVAQQPQEPKPAG